MIDAGPARDGRQCEGGQRGRANTKRKAARGGSVFEERFERPHHARGNPTSGNSSQQRLTTAVPGITSKMPNGRLVIGRGRSCGPENGIRMPLGLSRCKFRICPSHPLLCGLLLAQRDQSPGEVAWWTSRSISDDPWCLWQRCAVAAAGGRLEAAW